MYNGSFKKKTPFSSLNKRRCFFLIYCIKKIISYITRKNNLEMDKMKIGVFWIMFLLSLNFVNALNIDIDPNMLHFEEVLSGGYAEKIITITTDSNEALFVILSKEGATKDWISFSPNVSLKVSKSLPMVLKMMIKPPKNISKGIYSGSITLNIINKNAPEISSGKEIFFPLDMLVDITDKEIKRIEVKNIFVSSTEQNYPVDFFIKVQNKGNINANPVIRINSKGISHVKKIELLPSEEKEAIIPLYPNNLEVGKHLANISVFLDDQLIKNETSSFNILKKDSLIRKGSFLGMTNIEKVHVNNSVKINSYFKNSGEISVYARFRGRVFFNNSLIKEIESEQVYSPAGKTTALTSYFIPSEVGLYEITGDILYYNTLTEEKESFVNARPQSESLEVVPLGANKFVIVLLIIIVLLVIRINAKRKIKRSR